MVQASWNVIAHAQKPDFVFRRNGRVHLNRRRRQFSRLLAAEVCASAVVILDTPCSEVVWRVLATHSIRQFPLHFPTLHHRVTSHFNWSLPELRHQLRDEYISPVEQSISFQVPPSSLNDLAILDHLNHVQITCTNKSLHQSGTYRYASLNDGDAFWEMRRYAISSLCESVLTQT